MPTTGPTRVPRQFIPDHITGQLTNDDQPPTFRVYGTSTALRIARELGWLATWGYLSNTTHYGCGRYPQFEGRAGDLNLTAELRAVWTAIGHRLQDGPLTVITRTCDAAYRLGVWRDGSTEMPAGYLGSDRKTPMLEKLRRAIAANPSNLTIQVIDQSTGTPPAEDVERLAALAERWSRDNLDKPLVRAQAAALAGASLAVRGRP